MSDQKRAFSLALTSYEVPDTRELPPVSIHLDRVAGLASIAPLEFTADNKPDFLTNVTEVANQLWEAMADSKMV